MHEEPFSVGRTLRQARKALGWGMEEAAARIHVRPAYLQALEEERWDDLPSPAHVRGFLRLYARELGLDPEVLMRALEGKGVPTPSPTMDGSPPAPSPPAYDPVRERLQNLGQRLREQRERLGLSLAQVAQHVHVAERYLQALEEGDLERFPSPIQARGMLALYARFLHMDVDEILLRFAEALQHRVVRPQATSFTSSPWQRWLRWMGFALYGVLGLGVAMLLGWGGYLVWQAMNAEAQPSPTLPPVNTRPPVAAPALTAQALATVLVQGTSSITPAGARETPLPQGTPTPEGPVEQAPIFVVVEARARVWVRVLADGRPLFQGRLRPREQKTFRAEERLELLVGNAGALRVTYNQQDLGLLGDWGQVLIVVFTPQHVLTPTPTPTATPTITPTPTATVTPTATATPTPTLELTP